MQIALLKKNIYHTIYHDQNQVNVMDDMELKSGLFNNVHISASTHPVDLIEMSVSIH